ncbi:hypothetical protein [Paraburkholderia sp. GAS348]|uniref:hypothetical protein n=1 Tax=Paraburkholderia sp. GAS348 TaxID=3035132 RepID=UPI003D23EFA2
MISYTFAASQGRQGLGINAKLFILVMLVAIFEGAFRKWGSPAFTNPLLLLRDVAALILVLRTWLSGRFRCMKAVTQALLAWSCCVVIWGMLQLIVLEGPLLLFVLGLRFWLLYLWFALAAACSLSSREIVVAIRLLLVTSICLAPLVIAQHFLPPSSILNVQPDTEEDRIFRVAGDIVRTTGTFSFTLGFTCFLALVNPFVLSQTWAGRSLWRKGRIETICMLGLIASTAVCGSRAAIIFFPILLSIKILTSLTIAKSGRRLGGALLQAGMALIAIAVIGLIFNDAVVATQERFALASDSEDVGARVFTIFAGEPEVRDQITLLGHGLGAGTNAGAVVRTGDRTTFALAESEPARVLLEMGIVGLIWLVLKVMIVVIGLRRCWKQTRATGDPLPVLLWISTGYAMTAMPISGQISAHAFAYILLAFALACSRGSDTLFRTAPKRQLGAH